MARLLLVDDDAASLDLMRRALEADGHTIAVAENGADARDLLHKAPAAFECVVTDVNMPGMNGIDLLREARGISAGLRFVMISGFMEQLESAKGPLGTGLTTLAKPFTLDQIRAAVRQALA